MKNVEDIYPCTPLQQGILFHCISAPRADLYINQCSCLLQGDIDHTVFFSSWREILDRHSALRTAFLWEGLDEPLQVVRRKVRAPIVEQDWRTRNRNARQALFESYLVEDRRQGFELAQAPLMRLSLLRISEDSYFFVWTFHHLILDGWSISLLNRELLRIYETLLDGRPCRQSRPPAYKNFIAWLQQRDPSQTEAFWRRELGRFTAPSRLPVDRRSEESTERGHGHRKQWLSAASTQRLKSLAAKHHLTSNTWVQGAWAVLLGRYGATDDVAYGLVMSGRPAALRDAESMVGFFINTLPVRARIRSESTVIPWMIEFQAQQSVLREHEHTPLQQIQKWAAVEQGSPLFESVFAFENYPGDEAAGSTGRIRIRDLRVHESLNYLLAMEASLSDVLLLRVVYDRSHFDPTTIDRMIGHLRSLIEGILDRPGRRIGETPLLPQAERHQLTYGFNDAARRSCTDLCLHEIFAARVAQSANDIAAVLGDQTLTYRVLNRRANLLAHRLVALGVGPESLVGLCLERSLEMIVGILGILKAGGAYVPLDPTYPRRRLSDMVRDAGLRLVLTQPILAAAFSESPVDCIFLDDEPLRDATADTAAAQDPSVRMDPNHPAYVIFTSGSTGAPKGISVSHRNVVRLFERTHPSFGFDSRDVWSCFHSFAFDFSVWELWGALLYGGRVVVVPSWVTRSPADFHALLAEEGVTVLNQTPSFFNQVIRAEMTSEKLSANDLALRLVIFGGEALEPRNLKAWAQQAGFTAPRLVNMYGITETTVHVTYRPLEAADLARTGSVIGRPIPDLDLYILDPQLRRVPIGLPGEIYVGGAGLTRGYLGQPSLTANRFVADPFADSAGGRLYRTGDLARYRADGDVEYLGRSDRQVKVRGFRIELGEIEASLAADPDVQEAVVTQSQDREEDRRLVAYLVPDAKRGAAARRRARIEAESTPPEAVWHQLPNGMEIAHRNKSEADFLFQEIFTDKCYLKNGIALPTGACVFDVGANVGLSALFMARSAADSVVYAFEPIPPLFELLRLNTQLYDARVELFEFGLANESTRARFTYYPNDTVISGRYGDAAQDRETVKAYLLNRSDASSGAALPEEEIDDLLARRLASEEYDCELKTLSDVVREHRVEQIDLLKIDVEKSELDVLQGIHGNDWQKIRQIVIEVHDLDGRLATVTSLLRDRGFDCIVEQDAGLDKTCLYNVYARARGIGDTELARDRSDEPRPSWRGPSALLSDVRSSLEDQLPRHMVPASFVLLDALPLTVNGKIDYRALPEAKRSRSPAGEALVTPRNPVEEKLAALWGEVLGIEQVGVDDNFFALGGDSILSIQIVARATQAGLRFTPQEVFEHPTCARLATVARVPLVQARQGVVTGAVPLTPIQHWFFEQPLKNPHHFNQALALELGPTFPVAQLEAALRHVLLHHDALRLCFSAGEAGWQQHNAAAQESVPFLHVDATEKTPPTTLMAMADEIQASLDIEHGPLMRVALLCHGTKRRLLWVIHHLAVDGVSWPILIEDLVTACDQIADGRQARLPAKTTSFKTWAEHLADYACSEAMRNEAGYWLRLERYTGTPLPADLAPPGRPIRGRQRNLVATLEPNATRALLQEVPAAHRTQINDVLLLALAEAFASWTGERQLLLDLEGHGREDLFAGVDLSRTVGWFTSIYPVLLDLGDTARRELALQRIKAQLRSVPHNGIGFGLLRYLNDDPGLARRFRRLPRPQVCFNYFGQLDQTIAESQRPFRITTAQTGAPTARSTCRYLIEVNAYVADGQLNVEWSYPEDSLQAATVRSLASGFLESLRAVVLGDRDIESAPLSLVDFPSAQLDEGELEQLAGILDGV